MKFIYLIKDEDGCPIFTATTIEKCESLLREYLGEDFSEFVKYDDRGYFDVYEGFYVYEKKGIKEVFSRYYLPIDDLI